MKNLMIILTLILSTVLSAQNRPIQIEVVDRTEITMLAAQYDIMQREARENNNELNRDNAEYKQMVIGGKLLQLRMKTKDKNILERIKKAEKQNDKLAKRYNSRSYNLDLYKLNEDINIITSDIQKLTQ